MFRFTAIAVYRCNHLHVCTPLQITRLLCKVNMCDQLRFLRNGKRNVVHYTATFITVYSCKMCESNLIVIIVLQVFRLRVERSFKFEVKIINNKITILNYANRTISLRKRQFSKINCRVWESLLPISLQWTYFINYCSANWFKTYMYPLAKILGL